MFPTLGADGILGYPLIRIDSEVPFCTSQCSNRMGKDWECIGNEEAIESMVEEVRSLYPWKISVYVSHDGCQVGITNLCLLLKGNGYESRCIIILISARLTNVG